MNRLPGINAREMIGALKKAGFVEDGQKGSHLRLWHPTKKLLTTVPVHSGDLPRSLVRQIFTQAELTEDDFRELL